VVDVGAVMTCKGGRGDAAAFTERPMVMSGPSIPNIMDGSKTQTRRIARIPACAGDVHVDPGGTIFGPGPYLKVERTDGQATMYPRIYCPYGYPGDRLWIRERWQTGQAFDKLRPREIGELAIKAGYPKPWAALNYVEGGDKRNADYLRDFGGHWGRVRSPRHLPRWASRITLEIIEIRAQRLHEISEDDARAEGVDRDTEPCDHTRRACDEIGCMGPTYRSTFCALWDSINGKRAPWSSNPWVWACTFRRIA
jgi:hypothetical protein